MSSSAALTDGPVAAAEPRHGEGVRQAQRRADQVGQRDQPEQLVGGELVAAPSRTATMLQIVHSEKPRCSARMEKIRLRRATFFPVVSQNAGVVGAPVADPAPWPPCRLPGAGRAGHRHRSSRVRSASARDGGFRAPKLGGPDYARRRSVTVHRLHVTHRRNVQSTRFTRATSRKHGLPRGRRRSRGRRALRLGRGGRGNPSLRCRHPGECSDQARAGRRCRPASDPALRRSGVAGSVRAGRHIRPFGTRSRQVPASGDARGAGPRRSRRAAARRAAARDRVRRGRAERASGEPAAGGVRAARGRGRGVPVRARAVVPGGTVASRWSPAAGTCTAGRR